MPTENQHHRVRTLAERARQVLDKAAGSPTEFLRTWDKAQKSLRLALLGRFFEEHADVDEEELERMFGGAASLVLARLCAWLRLSCASQDPALFHTLKSIHIFLSSASSTRFAVEVVEQGGALTAVEVIGLDGVPDGCKAVAIDLLHSIALAGPKFRKILQACEVTRYLNGYLADGGTRVDKAADLLAALGDAAE